MLRSKTFKLVVAIILAIGVGYLGLNAKAVYKYFQYKLNPESLQNPSELLDIQKVEVQKNPEDTLPAGSRPQAAASATNDFNLDENWFSYPKLGIKAPIAWNVSVADSNTKMNDSLTHIQGTAVPGSGGEGLISGHSSHYWWQKGAYTEVFVNLPSAEIGDRLMINKNGLRTYQVSKKYEVGTDQYLEFKTAGSEVIKLMTCVPIGTNLRRLIIEAKLISVL